MKKTRVEAFSDGVLAIIVTIMVLELEVPEIGETSLHALKPLIPTFVGYVLSFLMVLIYWNNHHHLFHSVKHINGKVMMANGHLLFWLSILPFTTAWGGQNYLEPIPIALFGFNLIMCGFAYSILTKTLLAIPSNKEFLSKAIGQDTKGMISLIVYFLAIGLSFVHTLLACTLYLGVAILWLIPDKRIENIIHEIED